MTMSMSLRSSVLIMEIMEICFLFFFVQCMVAVVIRKRNKTTWQSFVGLTNNTCSSSKNSSSNHNNSINIRRHWSPCITRTWTAAVAITPRLGRLWTNITTIITRHRTITTIHTWQRRISTTRRRLRQYRHPRRTIPYWPPNRRPPRWCCIRTCTRLSTKTRYTSTCTHLRPQWVNTNCTNCTTTTTTRTPPLWPSTTNMWWTTWPRWPPPQATRPPPPLPLQPHSWPSAVVVA